MTIDHALSGIAANFEIIDINKNLFFHKFNVVPTLNSSLLLSQLCNRSILFCPDPLNAKQSDHNFFLKLHIQGKS